MLLALLVYCWHYWYIVSMFLFFLIKDNKIQGKCYYLVLFLEEVRALNKSFYIKLKKLKGMQLTTLNLMLIHF
jgi:hypothetical protein